VTTFRDEAFNDWTYSGCLPVTSANLTSIIGAGIAYAGGDRIEKDATSHDYTATKFTYVDLKSDGSYLYTEITPDSAPALASNTVRLARVETDSDNIVAVTDLRIMSITLENRQADFYRKGMNIQGSNVTFDELRIAPGVTYWGNVRVCKTTTTALDLDTAGDWVTGSAGANTWGYVVMNNVGTIKLSTTGPSIHDIGGTTVGAQYYAVIGADKYRVLGWFYMNGTNDINPWEWGNLQTDIKSYQTKRISSEQEFTSGGFIDANDTTVHFYVPKGKGVKVQGIMNGYSTTTGYAFNGAIKLDSNLVQATEAAATSTSTSTSNNGGGSLVTLYMTPELEMGTHTANLMVRQGGGYTGRLDWANIYVEVE
jgi:hypothetical protein